MAFEVFVLCHFQKLLLVGVEKFELIIAAWYLYSNESKNSVSDFEIVFQIGDINMLAFRGAFLKGHFLTKKISAVKSETHFSKEAVEN